MKLRPRWGGGGSVSVSVRPRSRRRRRRSRVAPSPAVPRAAGAGAPGGGRGSPVLPVRFADLVAPVRPRRGGGRARATGVRLPLRRAWRHRRRGGAVQSGCSGVGLAAVVGGRGIRDGDAAHAVSRCGRRERGMTASPRLSWRLLFGRSGREPAGDAWAAVQRRRAPREYCGCC
ncbi:hypothetical protein PVAP13_2KG380510 [Panicum virgatum]|uniref:Uncharacterized protein n=1 Tax=Panicum virgatum TaxID=38727 RepID=A0A8T0WBQ0_PANVG|nr:hypothetical protein PVAP13_2KG380510 [Panicum virgatum]